MMDTQAIGFIGSMCVRMFGLLVLIAEVDIQRESFRKMEADLKEANDTCNTLRASVAGLKETVEKLKAKKPTDEELVNMQVMLNNFAHEWMNQPTTDGEARVVREYARLLLDD